MGVRAVLLENLISAQKSFCYSTIPYFVLQCPIYHEESGKYRPLLTLTGTLSNALTCNVESVAGILKYCDRDIWSAANMTARVSPGYIPL